MLTRSLDMPHGLSHMSAGGSSLLQAMLRRLSNKVNKTKGTENHTDHTS